MRYSLKYSRSNFLKMHSFNKRPAFMYAKEFKLDKVLGNLQGYKIATGQVSKEELRNVSRKYGSDEGAVLGSLITNAAGHSNKEENSSEPPAKKRRKKRRRGGKAKNAVRAESSSVRSETSSVVISSSDEPLCIPAALLAYKDTVSSDGDGSKCDKKSVTNSSTSSSTDSDDSDEDNVDFFGLHNSKSVSSMKTPGSSSTSKTYTTHQESRQSGHSNLPEKEAPVWDPSRLKYTDQISTLSTYKCWKCRRVGHLAEDCTVNVNSTSGSLPHSEKLRCHQNQINTKAQFYSRNLKDYYKRCQKLRESKDVTCSECGAKSNLAYCFECGLVLCDGRGHLIDHLLEYPSHTKLFSYKLQRQIKCCKSTCDVVDATELLTCSSCLDRAFTSHYSMINATWSRTGLKAIPNTLACEQHFHWHRMNCVNASGETLVSREKLESCKMKGEGLLTEFFF